MSRPKLNACLFGYSPRNDENFDHVTVIEGIKHQRKEEEEEEEEEKTTLRWTSEGIG